MKDSLLSGVHKVLLSFGYGESPLNILDHLAILLIEFFSSQMNLFVRLFVAFIMFPFQVLSRLREISVYSILTSFIYKRIETQKSVIKMGMRFCWALVCAICVWFILLGMLISAFVIGGFMMKCVVMKPIEVTEMLNFDYTMVSPVAVVPLSSSFSLNNRKLQVTVSLTMPESEYNRKLGVFQVRMDFLSTTGKITSSANYPCMLRFKSQPIRIAETVLKSVPLMAGLQAEVQNFNINFDEFYEPKTPTAGIRVILEQRAEYKHDGGIPEVYSASLHLRSKLPQMKQILWSWRITAYVWISIMSFLTQMLVGLTFYRATLTKAKKQNKISW